jgi:hypothetical protein
MTWQITFVGPSFTFSLQAWDLTKHLKQRADDFIPKFKVPLGGGIKIMVPSIFVGHNPQLSLLLE